MQQTFRILASLALTILFAVELSSCNKGSTAATTTTTTGTPAPVNEVDAMINDYEKLTNEYLKVSKRLKGGDVSVTIPYIQLAERLREWPVKLQQISVKMTPQQAQRAANVSAETAADLQK